MVNLEEVGHILFYTKVKDGNLWHNLYHLIENTPREMIRENDKGLTFGMLIDKLSTVHRGAFCPFNAQNV